MIKHQTTIKRNLRSFYKVFFILMLFVFSSCRSTVIPVFSSQQVPISPNFENASSWAILPNAYPEKLKQWQTNHDDLQADVFYIYPTLNTDKKDLRWNVSISDTLQIEKVINKAVFFQASAFLNAGKLYVPFYRQAHLRSYFNYENGGKEALDLAYSDVKKAFEFYLENYNKKRPIIIASHSQGTTHAIRILKDFFDGKPLQNKLVAAYIPGIAIKKNEFEELQIMTSPSQIGGFVSWNTFKKNYYPKKYNEWFKGAVVSNPITWNESKESLRSQHKGFLFTNEERYAKALQVYVKDGILWTSLPHFPFRYFVIGKKNYHEGDINLFWEDIRENALVRVKAFLKKQELITGNDN